MIYFLLYIIVCLMIFYYILQYDKFCRKYNDGFIDSRLYFAMVFITSFIPIFNFFILLLVIDEFEKEKHKRKTKEEVKAEKKEKEKQELLIKQKDKKFIEILFKNI